MFESRITYKTADDVLSACTPIPESGCWIWPNAQNSGYPCARVNSKSVLLHRYIYEEHYGKLPPGICVLHKCDVPFCLNPHHLYEGTQSENIEDRQRKNRQSKGNEHGSAKLTEDDVREIRKQRKAGIQLHTLASQYDVSHTTIRHAAIGKTWRHI